MKKFIIYVSSYIKIFVDTDADIRLARRLKRDIGERGRSIDSVLAQYNKYVKPSFEYYIAPTMPSADIIVPRGGDNEIAIDLIVKHVHRELYHVNKVLSDFWPPY